MTRITTTVETVSITDIKEGDTILRDGGERTVVAEVTSCVPHLLRYRDTNGTERYYFSDCAVRVVPEEPAEEEPVWPDVDLIRIIRGTENGNRIDGSLAARLDGVRGFRLIDGPKAGTGVLPTFDGDAIFEWEEVVPVTKSAILAGLGTTDDEPEDDDTDDVDGEEETEDEDECDGSCLACILMRLLTAAAAGKDKEGEE